MGDHQRRAPGPRLAQRRLDRRLGGASTAVVASSRIRMRGSASRARAIATRWRWPPEEGEPALADPGVVAVGQFADEAVGLGEARRRFDLRAARRAARVGDVVGDAGGEEEAVVGDEGDLRAQPRELDVADVDAVDRAGPRSGRRGARSARPGSSCRTPRARPAPPSCPPRPRGDVVQRRHRLVFGARRRRVTQRHVAQLDPAAAAAGSFTGSAGLSIDGSRSMISNIRLPEATARWAVPIATRASAAARPASPGRCRRR